MLGIDGIDHINVYSKGKTELGRWLSNFAYSPVDLPEGRFNSIEGYWYFLLTGNNELRDKYGFEAKNIGRESARTSIGKDKTQEFIDAIKSAIDTKLKSNKVMLHEFSKSELPFRHYYTYGEIVREAGHQWVIQHLEYRREQLKDWYGRVEVR